MKQYEAGQQSDQDNIVRESHCPVCDSQELDYGSIELNGNHAYYPWTCENCGSTGQEWYSMNFNGQNVKEEKL